MAELHRDGQRSRMPSRRFWHWGAGCCWLPGVSAGRPAGRRWRRRVRTHTSAILTRSPLVRSRRSPFDQKTDRALDGHLRLLSSLSLSARELRRHPTGHTAAVPERTLEAEPDQELSRRRRLGAVEETGARTRPPIPMSVGRGEPARLSPSLDGQPPALLSTRKLAPMPLGRRWRSRGHVEHAPATLAYTRPQAP